MNKLEDKISMTVFVVNTEGNMWEDNIKTNLRKIE
jgi:hypothetical protein